VTTRLSLIKVGVVGEDGWKCGASACSVGVQQRARTVVGRWSPVVEAMTWSVER